MADVNADTHDSDEPDQSRHADRVRALFDEAAALPQSDRERFVKERSGEDLDLQREVMALLEHHDDHDDEDEGIAFEDTAVDDSTVKRWIGRTIGGVTLRHQIGSGGMGAVFAGTQHNPRRSVAVKILRDAIPSERALRRFEYEAQMLARMEHPGITRIHAIDVLDEHGIKIPYFVMEYIRGARSITEYADEQKLDLRERLQLFTQVCDAVGHAHQKGVVHRDIKPANVLVDSRGHAQVIDFGIARSIDNDLTETMFQTLHGQVIGTLRYMAPEQFAHSDDLDARTDVYSLGILLYELLLEQPPYELTNNLPEAQRVIKEVEPKRPSSIDRRLRGDIETILLKALEKDRERRYRDAATLGEDITRYLHDEPVVARPPTPLYTLKKLASRHRPLVGASVLAVSVIVISAVISLFFFVGRQQALEAGERAVQVKDRAKRDQLLITQALYDILDNLNVPSVAARRGEDGTWSDMSGATIEIPPIDEENMEWASAFLDELLFLPALERIEIIGEQEGSPRAAAEVAREFRRAARYAKKDTMNHTFALRELAWAERIKPIDKIRIAAARTSLGASLTDLGRHDDAHLELNRSEALLDPFLTEENKNRTQRTRARNQQYFLIQSRGDLLENEGKLNEARDTYIQAMELGANLNDQMMVRNSATHAGRVAYMMGEYAEAFELLSMDDIHLEEIRNGNLDEIDERAFLNALYWARTANRSGRTEEELEMYRALCDARSKSDLARSMQELDEVCDHTGSPDSEIATR